MGISEKQKMLGAGLYARGVKKEITISILMVLTTDDEVDDLVWYMGQNPKASGDELLAVAYQLAKETAENRGKR